MNQRDQERARQLDQRWDQFQDAGQQSSGEDDDDCAQISRLQTRDDAPPPAPEFRRRLQAELQAMHPGVDSSQSGDMDEDREVPTNSPIGSPPRGPITFTRPGSFRQWGELAAIVAVLSLAIVGAALYGDDVYDYAQRSLSSSDDDSVDISEHAAILEEEGKVDGLTFEEAQALTPFELAEPSILPEGASIENRSVTKSEVDERGKLLMVIWRATSEITIGDEPPILLHQQPKSGNIPAPLPQHSDQDERIAHLQTVQIGDTGAVQVTGQSDDGEVVTHYMWQQGEVDVWVELPFDVADSGNPVEELEQMMASITDQGALHDGGREIPNRQMSLAELRELLPTVPVADPTPEHLELRYANMAIHGPHFSYEHAASADVDEIWIRGMGADPAMRTHDRISNVVSETVNVDSVPVSHHILLDRFAPETSEFIGSVGLHADLLLPWISSSADTALAVYMWDVAGQGYLMGVEIPRDRIETEAPDQHVIATDRPESDWLAIISAQEQFVAEHLDPQEIFPVLADEPTKQDQFPDVAYMTPREGEDVRLIHETENGLYFLASDDQQNLLMLYQFVYVEGEDEPRASGGGASLWRAAESGIVQQMGGDGGLHIAWVLPQGYDEVVDQDGNLVGNVENQLFAQSFGDGEPRPRPLIARGPAGELEMP